MSSLPPYSTYRTDNKQMMYPQAISHGNILAFTPPGFKQCLNVKFPDCRLAVCEKCKKNYKTRDMCRVRNSHTAEPWSTAYICITLDDTCTDENGKYVDKPLTVRMVQWQPFCVKKPFDNKTPVCSACKKTNRTRSFCRNRHQHKHLPWCTVYVLLSALDSTDPSTVVAAPSKVVSEGDDTKKGGDEDSQAVAEEKKTDTPSDTGEDQGGKGEGKGNGEGKDEVKEEGKGEGEDGNKVKDEGKSEEKGEVNEEEPTEGTAEADGKANKEKPVNSKPDPEADHATDEKTADKESDKIRDEGDDEGDDVNDIAESRTFLVKVSCRAISVHWLELAEYDGSGAPGIHGLVPPDGGQGLMRNPGMVMPGMDPTHAHYYAHAMGYAAHQHQHALKTQQQYFYQMQQRQQQHFAAQQAAWQAQYNGQPPPGQGPPPGAAPGPQPLSGQTAGEAAAMQQKQNQAAGLGKDPNDPSMQQHQQHPHQPWQPQMMYPHQYYQPPPPQYPMPPYQGPPPMHPPQQMAPSPNDGPGMEEGNMDPTPVNGEALDGEADPKRRRMV